MQPCKKQKFADSSYTSLSDDEKMPIEEICCRLLKFSFTEKVI